VSEEIASASRALDVARERLEQRSDDEIIRGLAEVFELWRDAGSACRRELEAKLPAAAGFTPESVRAGLAIGFEPWTGDAFVQLVAQELASIPNARGHARTSVVLAGSIPMPSVLSILLPLALRSPVLCKPASRDIVTANLVADSIRAVDPLLADCVAIVPFDKEDTEAAVVFFSAPCVVATGSSETIEEVEAQLSPDQARLLYGHRVSIGVVELDGLEAEALDATADKLAIDVALWNQLGCLSPTTFYLVGRDEKAPDAFAESLSRALAKREQEWPRGPITIEAGAMIAQERSDAEMRAAMGEGTRVLASEGTRWTVVLESDVALRPAPLHRFIRVTRVDDLSALMQAITPLASVLAGVALSGFESNRDDLTRDLMKLGASRVCAPGQLQAPPIDWPRDNQPLLRNMVATRK
jgi:hypothetical protein